MDLLGSGLFVHMAGPGEGGPNPAVAVEAATQVAPEAQPAAPQTPEKTENDVKAKMDEAYNKLETKYKDTDAQLSPAEDRALSKFKDLIGKTTDAYNKKLGETPKPDEKAKEAMMKPVDDLITQINAREKSGATELATLNEGADPKTAEKLKLLGKAKTEIMKLMLNSPVGKEWAKEISHEIGGTSSEKVLDSESFLKNSGFDDYLTEVLMRMPEADLKELEAGREPKLTKENLKAVMDGLRASVGYEKLSDPDDKEKSAIKTLKLGEKTFDEALGKDSPIPELISRLHEVEVGDKGALKIDGKAIADIKDLGQFLPPSMRDGFDKVASGSPTDEEKKALNESTTAENGRYDRLQKSIKNMDQTFGKMIEGQGRLGSIEAIGVLFQMYGMIKAGDWESLNEAMDDFNSKPPKNPAKIMKECSKAYEEKLAEQVSKVPASNLLDAYLEPRGTKANEIFGPSNGVPPSGRYRGAICEPIAKQFESQLGIGHIDKITRDGSHVVIDSGEVAYHIYKSGERLVRQEGTIKESRDKDGKVTATSHPKPSGTPTDLGGKDVTLTQIKDSFDAKAKVESERVTLENTKNTYKGVIDKLETRDKTTLLDAIGKEKFEGKLDDKYPKLDSKINKPTEEQQQALNQERAKYIVANFQQYKPVMDGRKEFDALKPKVEKPVA